MLHTPLSERQKGSRHMVHVVVDAREHRQRRKQIFPVLRDDGHSTAVLPECILSEIGAHVPAPK